MIIENSNRQDIEEIFRLYRLATDLQRTKNIVLWPEFERSLIELKLMKKDNGRL
ncbi:hypothetical protein ACMGDK_06555 [Chryseobacterium sp. DT-3]|uniref:hypothetical protein n=1 Tax=Chryseobacterium sp. DT-3 TaxID=3396164 RepID=UPI003F1D62EC